MKIFSLLFSASYLPPLTHSSNGNENKTREKQEKERGYTSSSGTSKDEKTEKHGHKRAVVVKKGKYESLSLPLAAPPHVKTRLPKIPRCCCCCSRFGMCRAAIFTTLDTSLNVYTYIYIFRHPLSLNEKTGRRVQRVGGGGARYSGRSISFTNLSLSISSFSAATSRRAERLIFPPRARAYLLFRHLIHVTSLARIRSRSCLFIHTSHEVSHACDTGNQFSR